MRNMKKSKMICAVVLTGVLGAAALAGCSSPAEGGATYNPGEPPLMPAMHEGRFEKLGANGCYGCHGSSDEAEVFLAAATPLPADHYAGGDVTSRQIDGPRAECITCHPVSQE